MKEKIASLFFFAVLISLLAIGARLLSPFSGAILSAIAVGTVFYPMHRKLSHRLKGSPSLVAVLSDLMVLLFFVLPIALLIWALVSEADTVIPVVKDWLQNAAAWVREHRTDVIPGLDRLPEGLRRQVDVHSATVQERLVNVGNRVFRIVAASTTAIAAQAFQLVFDIIIFLFVLFFVFRDGESLFRKFMQLLPMDAASKSRIQSRVHLTLIAVVRGTFLTALVQGMVAAIGFLIARTSAAFVLGFLTAVATLIPSVGTALIWIPVAIYYFVMGPLWKGIFIVAWGVFVVGLVDNVLRPFIVGTKAEIPFLWLFFGLLGGIELFGMLGIFLGPILFGLIAVWLDIYQQHYLEHRSK